MDDSSSKDKLRAAINALKEPSGAVLDPYQLMVDYRLCGKEDNELDETLWQRLKAQWNVKTGDYDWTPQERGFAEKLFRSYVEVLDLGDRASQHMKDTLNMEDIPQARQKAYLNTNMKQNNDLLHFKELMTSLVTRNAVVALVNEGGLDGYQENPKKAQKLIGTIIGRTLDCREEVVGTRGTICPPFAQLKNPDTLVQDAQYYPRAISRSLFERGVGRD